ncbi:MAG: SOS response-associated peptidase [Chloroflexi bacterium]|nr:SOS response-associated peptidase [Chloroflexota bacterium]
MCGRFSVATDQRTLEERFSFTGASIKFAPSYNVAPTDEVLTVTARRPEYMRWGLVPGWAKDLSIGSRMINAKAETIADRPSFRAAFRKRRCLVVADGYYEWRRVGGRRQPFRIVLRSGEPFAFAGVWESWRPPDGAPIRSCAIITTRANSVVEPIHDRMPVILPRSAEAMWLDRDIEDPALLTELLQPISADEVEAYEVSTLVNSVANNVPECIAPRGPAPSGQAVLF